MSGARKNQSTVFGKTPITGKIKEKMKSVRSQCGGRMKVGEDHIGMELFALTLIKDL